MLYFYQLLATRAGGFYSAIKSRTANERVSILWKCRRCDFKFPACVHPFPQIWHRYGSSPLCTNRCWRNVDGSAKRLPHSSQPNGRSPVWVRSCRSWLLRYRKHRLHQRHANGRSSLCSFWWLRNDEHVLNRAVHLAHVYLRISLCVTWWRLRWLWFENSRPHCSQMQMADCRSFGGFTVWFIDIGSLCICLQWSLNWFIWLQVWWHWKHSKDQPGLTISALGPGSSDFDGPSSPDVAVGIASILTLVSSNALKPQSKMKYCVSFVFSSPSDSSTICSLFTISVPASSEQRSSSDWSVSLHISIFNSGS